MIAEAKAKGYHIHLCCLRLATVQHSIRRVRERVRKGGHDVPLADLKRRFRPSLRNFFHRYLPLADKAALYDSTLQEAALVAKEKNSILEIILPLEYEKILAKLR